LRNDTLSTTDSMYAPHTWENFPYIPYMVNTATFTASVYTTGACFSCMAWELHLGGFPFLSENLSTILFFVKSPFSFVH